MSETMHERIRRLKIENRKILNRLESHLGCVVCRGPLTLDGACLVCDPEDLPKEQQ